MKKFNLVRVIDGDTYEIELIYRDEDFDISCSRLFKMRLFGVNCPEVKGAQASQGLAAKNFVQEILEKNEFSIEFSRSKNKPITDKYGRFLGEIALKQGKLSQLLIDSGHAVFAKYDANLIEFKYLLEEENPEGYYKVLYKPTGEYKVDCLVKRKVIDGHYMKHGTNDDETDPNNYLFIEKVTFDN